MDKISYLVSELQLLNSRAVRAANMQLHDTQSTTICKAKNDPKLSKKYLQRDPNVQKEVQCIN